MIPDPRSQGVSFTAAAATPNPPAVDQAGILIAPGNNANLVKLWGEAASVRAYYAEGPLSENAEAHFRLDERKHPIFTCATEIGETQLGALHIDISGVTGTSVPSAPATPAPLGDWPGLIWRVKTGGTIGQPGIVISFSLDGGLQYVDYALGIATSLEIAVYGLKLNFAAGDLNDGDVITGWTDPPSFDATTLGAAFDAILARSDRFSLIGIEPALLPSFGAQISAFLDDLEASIPGRDCHLFGSMRRQYRDVTATIEATFSAAGRTITRTAGSFVTDGFKAGMVITPTGSVSNNGTFIKVLTVAAGVLTMTANVTLVDEGPTASVTIVGSEPDDQYVDNTNEEWSGFSDNRVTLTRGTIIANRPYDAYAPQRTLGGLAWMRSIAEPIGVEVAQRQAVGGIGGPVAAKLNGRVQINNEWLCLDSAKLASHALAPSRALVLQTDNDGSGPYFVRARTMYHPTNPETQDLLLKARLAIAAKNAIRPVLAAKVFSAFDPNLSDPLVIAFSDEAKKEIEADCYAALRKRLKGAASNLDVEDPTKPLFRIIGVDENYVVSCEMFIRTKLYPAGFVVTFSVAQPGE